MTQSMNLIHHKARLSTFIVIICLLIPGALSAQGQFTFEDVLKFEDIKTPVISANGNWVAYGVWPEIGDGYVEIKQVGSQQQFTIERGEQPQISNDGRWTGAFVNPPFIEAENAGSDAPNRGVTFLSTSNGETIDFADARNFSFSNNSEWGWINHFQDDEIESNGNSHLGTPLTLVQLNNRESQTIDFVHESAVDSTSNYLIYSVVDTTGTGNGIYLINLNGDVNDHQKIAGFENALFSNLTWDHKTSRVAFTQSEIKPEQEFLTGDATIYTMKVGEEPTEIVRPENINDGYRLRSQNQLTWTNDGNRLFYGVMSAEMVALDEHSEEADSLTTENLYSVDRILNNIEGSVWHWDDPQIKTHEKQTWTGRKNHLFRSVYHIDTDRSVQLATVELPDVWVTHNEKVAIGTSDIPYQKLRTWDGTYRDYYLIDLETANSDQFLEKQRFGASLSPNGNFAAWFDGEDWIIRGTQSGTERNLTADISTPFYDEDNDRPQPSGSYGIAGWTDNDRQILINDKFDIWQFDTRTGNQTKISDGRDERRIFRIYDLNPNKQTFSSNERLLLTMYHDDLKNYGFYEARVGRSGVNRVLEGEKRFNIVALADDSDEILFTQETYREYPNLWVAGDRRFRNPVQVSNLHEGLTDEFAWGHAELVDWYNSDGKKVQGVLYYPGNYEPGKRYPVFIYYYERFSQRLYDFNKPVTNHRPNIAQYTSDGYAVFLPDIWFDVPIPGYSATKNLVPGVHKLIEMGIADPDAIGLHGHSWSGYLTAHVVTQTDIFAAAVAGAPVGNMTSAYSGIRWGTGLARQFQYEQTQSRLGVSMWENLAPYIENSPVFFADRINTPLMIQHGDADEAVPWYQSIELYLALRRNGKESVFLHYYDEPHHLRKLANRLDYAIKMKEYMDHYLKGIPAPDWIKVGVPFRGE